MTKISHISWGGYDKGFYGIISHSYYDYSLQYWNKSYFRIILGIFNYDEENIDTRSIFKSILVLVKIFINLWDRNYESDWFTLE